MSEPHPLNLIVVGGNAGGMSFATRARRLSEKAQITVFETGSYVSFANCIIKDDKALTIQTPQSLKARFNVDVHPDSDVVGIDREAKTVKVKVFGENEWKLFQYDKLVLAQGAEPFRPPIEGLDSEHRIHGSSGKKVTDVAIIGGGFIGIEVVDALSSPDTKVHILEYTPHVFPQLDSDIAHIIQTELQRNGVVVITNARMQKIEKGSVILENHHPIPADVVIGAVGARGRTALAKNAGLAVGRTGVAVNDSMKTSDPSIYAAGDMVETYHRVAQTHMNTALAGPANRQGRLAADNIFGRAVSYRGNVGTSACKVFDLTVASTGLSVQVLKRMGRKVEWVTVHPPDHAGYYPGATPITLKVAFDPDTGVLLGAQAVGKNGVDKRIDVLSTATQGNMTIFDLEHLELAYAPPYGSAKDPVNMAGFAGSNVMRGDVEIIHAENISIIDLIEKEVVDVRSTKEFANGHLKTAINIPIEQLREKMEDLNKAREILVYCQVGYRGYLGYRILKQAGFDVKNLDGGFKLVVDGGFESLQDRSAK
ncbi:related to pyridine nucleotide-disulfide oxidoreductase [Phialocephala subalpina]|uniref:Related to pyridine nucleotide-disulfide oxidoreductase n=1 Tax=Phialocephala subalpina TaxID=576137 RepID=A0A1L7WTL4_9HELO|nr:related to pyridine nucleotide-disulfide oxidoreductase [Phialocephala subalpina]